MADYAIHDTTLIGISNVIRKKDGTSALIDPADYADRINLMGMLEEKTVSSSPIVTFSDGADSVPLKKCEITLPASLSGYSEVNGVQTRKNLLPDTNYMANYFSVAANGVVSQITTGAPYAWSYTNCIFKTTLPAGTYTAIEELVTDVTNASHGVQVFKSSDVRITSVSGGVKTAGVYSSTFTLSEKTDIGIVCKLYDGTAKLYIVSGSASTTYEPYNAKNYTEQLGRTIYGGSVDVVKGQGESSYKIITVGNSGWNYYSAGGYIYRDFSDKVIPEIGDSDHILVTDNPDMPYGGVNYASQFQDLHIYQAHNHAIYIKDTSCTSLNDFYTKYSNMKIGYELATPETFTFTPITPTPETALGVNNFWADEGDSEVTYRSMGTAYIYPNAEEASF